LDKDKQEVRMARKKHEGIDETVKITPNQIVAFNLTEARRLRGWTQEEAAAELEPYVGARWSKATFSSAERSIDGRRVRQFTADEIVAFSRCFDVPIGYFFMPPRPSQSETPVRFATAEDHDRGLSLAELLDAIFGTPGEREVMSARLNEYLGEIPMQDLTDAQDRLTWQAEDALNALVMKQLGRFDEWEAALTGLTSQVRSWKSAAKAAAVRQALHEEGKDG
jgi:transcriptional regulator with XRE-family HTH domain